MTLNVVELPKKAVSPEEALEVLDSIREAIASGEIKAFVCVGIQPNHTTLLWHAATSRTTKLELIGAMQNMQYGFQHSMYNDE